MKVITLTNEKGGVGKTTLSLHIAAGLALQGKRVLLIDSDPQSHCAQQLSVKEYGGLYRLLVQDEEWKSVLREPEFKYWGGTQPTTGRLLLLPGNIETRLIPMAISNPMALRERLAELEDHVDVTIIDTSPTPSLLQMVVYFATDAVIYPTKLEMLSLDGLAKSTLHLAQQNEARKQYGLDAVQLLGVQPTMFTPTNAHFYGLELVEEHFGKSKIWQPLRNLTVWREREYELKTLYAYAPTHEATEEVDGIVTKVAQYVA